MNESRNPQKYVYVYLKSLLFSQKSVRPRTEFLIGAVRLQLSITSQMCHLSVILTFHSCWRKRKMANSDCELVSFYSTVEETLNCLSKFNVGKKRSSFYAGSRKGFTDHVANQLLEKPDISGLVFMKEIMTVNLRAQLSFVRFIVQLEIIME